MEFRSRFFKNSSHKKKWNFLVMLIAVVCPVFTSACPSLLSKVSQQLFCWKNYNLLNDLCFSCNTGKQTLEFIKCVKCRPQIGLVWWKIAFQEHTVSYLKLNALAGTRRSAVPNKGLDTSIPLTAWQRMRSIRTHCLALKVKGISKIFVVMLPCDISVLKLLLVEQLQTPLD